MDLESPVVQRHSWNNECSQEEIDLTNELMTQIADLKAKGLTGTHLAAVFLKRRVQPLQARAEPMWTYKGASDTSRLRPEELSKNELESCLRSISKVKDSELIDLTPAVLPFCATNPPTMVSRKFLPLFCLFRSDCFSLLLLIFPFARTFSGFRTRK